MSLLDREQIVRLLEALSEELDRRGAEDELAAEVRAMHGEHRGSYGSPGSPTSCAATHRVGSETWVSQVVRGGSAHCPDDGVVPVARGWTCR